MFTPKTEKTAKYCMAKWKKSNFFSAGSGNRRKEGQGAVFSSFHDFAFAGAFVVDAAEVEDAVNDDAVELLVVGGAETGGVVRGDELLAVRQYGVEADEHIAAYHIGAAVVEGDDVREIVMSKELHVDLKDSLIAAERVAKRAHALPVGDCHGGYPRLHLNLVNIRHYDAVCLKSNHLNLWFFELKLTGLCPTR